VFSSYSGILSSVSDALLGGSTSAFLSSSFSWNTVTFPCIIFCYVGWIAVLFCTVINSTWFETECTAFWKMIWMGALFYQFILIITKHPFLYRNSRVRNNIYKHSNWRCFTYFQNKLFQWTVIVSYQVTHTKHTA